MLKKIILIISLSLGLIIFQGCNEKTQSNTKIEVEKVEQTNIVITKINPPKHYRVYGALDGENIEFQLHSKKRCSMKAKVGDIVQGEKTTFKDGTYKLQVQNKNQFCK